MVNDTTTPKPTNDLQKMYHMYHMEHMAEVRPGLDGEASRWAVAEIERLIKVAADQKEIIVYLFDQARANRAVAPSEDEIVGAIERAFYDPASVDAVHLSNPHTIAARAVIALLNRKSPDTASTPVFSVEAFERGRIVGETVGWYAAKGDKSQSSPDNDTAAIVRQQGCKMLDMKDEIERLRTALQRIVAEAESDDGLTAWDGADIARAALSSGSCTEGER